MRKFVLGASAALALAAGEAAAQEPPSQAPAPIVPVQGVGGDVLLDGGAPVVPYGVPLEGVAVSGPVSGGGGGGSSYVEASYLLMWASDADFAVPLASGGISRGIVGQPGFSLLAGGRDVDYGTLPGFKVAVGRFIGGSNVGFEVAGFYLGDDTQTTRLGPTSTTVIARPFFDTTSRAENVRVIASPNAFRGGIEVSSGVGAFGLETSTFVRTRDAAPFTLDLLAGFRYLQHQEDLTVVDTSTLLAGGTTAVNGVGLAAPSRVEVSDAFHATNIFYGGQVGAKFGFGRGPLFLDLTTKVAIGGVYQRVTADGRTTVTGSPFPAPTTTGGGFLTSNGLSGVRTDGRFAVLPEGNLQLGYQFTSWLNAFAGYSVMYLSSAARPTEQVTRSFSVNGLPTSPTFRPVRTQNIEVVDGDLWLHGFNFGVTASY